MREARTFQHFLAIWLGQVVSQVGSRISSFALGVWVYQRAGAVTDLALVALCDALPILLLTPVTGLVVDLYDRRRVMLVADACAALGTVGVAALLLTGHFAPWHLYAAVVLNASASAFQQPAYTAAVALIVPGPQQGRAVGMVEMGVGLAHLVAPALAGMLLGRIGLPGILLLDFTTFLVAASVLLFGFRLPPTPPLKEGRQPVAREVLEGWRYIAARPGLVGLITFTTCISLATACVEVLVPPLLLSFTTPDTMGVLVSICGAGALAGSGLMSAWGGPRRRVNGLLGFGLLLGAGLMVGGAVPHLVALTAAGFTVMFCVPMLWGCNQTLWQSKVPPALQGRTLAARLMVSQLALVVAFLLAGPLADSVFEPLLAPGGALASSVGALTGVGPGRGIAFFFSVLGALLSLATAAVLLHPRVRHLEDEPGGPDTPPAASPLLPPEPAGAENSP
ncbi:MFS transporter [Cystobacter ferrugineus]|uniref:MFS transporter n=1 Tax=Cystobacter ferrugineus TaxID=83449 RepID=A0A1L9B8L1_9BACT|nr:MFS transporter [Cystobacter ferrugineus]OJH38600.1 hypothetical protein BON30_20375 [Cystobacter ferrugineus]